MMDMSSDLVGSGIPFLQYRTYAERIFFPGHQESPLRRELDVPEGRRQTVEQGLFIHTLEVQRTFSPRDRAYVASLLTVALHGKLEYFTDILKTLLNDLVEQYGYLYTNTMMSTMRPTRLAPTPTPTWASRGKLPGPWVSYCTLPSEKARFPICTWGTPGIRDSG
ncbi:hypothetical protein CRUP_025252 [Coryphaenoides rupestris]|nr:hypothetical protein CRUP_025252 [Coryphaenoides rupestris]